LDKNTEAFNSEIIMQERKLSDSYHRVAVRYDLSDGEFWVLYCLTYPEVEWTQSNISAVLEVSKQTVHSSIRKLISRGYVTLDAASASRNRKRVVPTAEGEAFLAGTLQKVREAETKAYKAIGKPAMDQYLELEKAIVTNLAGFLDEV